MRRALPTAPLTPACLAGVRLLPAPALGIVSIWRVGIAVRRAIGRLIVVPATVPAPIVVAGARVIVVEVIVVVTGVAVILAMVAPVAEPVLMGLAVVAVCLAVDLAMFPVGAAVALTAVIVLSERCCGRRRQRHDHCSKQELFHLRLRSGFWRAGVISKSLDGHILTPELNVS